MAVRDIVCDITQFRDRPTKVVAIPETTSADETLILSGRYVAHTRDSAPATLSLPVPDSGSITYTILLEGTDPTGDSAIETYTVHLTAGADLSLADLLALDAAAPDTFRQLIDTTAVRFDIAQSLTNLQKAQARANIGAGTGSGSGGGLVDGDYGDVTVSGDGTVITIDNNAVTNAKVATGLDAAKIGNGSVSNAEFQRLDGVTSAIQTQIDGKANTSHSHAIGDVTGLQTAIDGKQATLVSGSNIKTINGNSLLGAGDLTISGGGGGASAIDDLSDVTITSAASGDFLRHNGTAWVDSTIQAGDIPSGVDAARIGSGAVSNTEFGYLDGVTSAIQTQLDGKAATSHNHDATYQPLDSDLTTIAGLSASNDDLLQRKAGAWINRTPAQVKTDLALSKSDVGLGNVDNTSDANKPVSTATQTALDAKENAITGGTTSQYWRGDKSWQTLDKSAVGLGNVANADTTTTANITDATDKRLITDAQRTVLQNTSGTNTGDQFTNTTASRLLGRGSASGAGAAQEISIGSGLSLSGTTLSATGGGVSVSSILLPFHNWTNNSNQPFVGTANQVRFARIQVRETISVAQIGFRLQIVSAGGLCAIGIYSLDGNTKLIDSGARSTGTQANLSTTLGAAVELTPNDYLLAWTADNTTAQTTAVAALTSAFSLHNQNDIFWTGTAANSSSSGVLPATLGALAAAAVPIPCVKLED